MVIPDRHVSLTPTVLPGRFSTKGPGSRPSSCRHRSVESALGAITVLPIIEAEAAFQIGYLTNLNQGDSYINLTNAGTLNGVDPDGRICVNVYTFDPAEELLSCCACPCRAGGLGADNK